MIQKFRGEKLNWSASAALQFKLDFLPERGKRQGRMIIDKLWIEVILNLTTAGGVTVSGAEQAACIRRLRVYDNVSDLVRLSGMKLRQQGHIDMRQLYPTDPSTFAAAQTANMTYEHVVQFTAIPGLAHDFTDYGLAVDQLKRGGGIELTCPAATGDLLGTGGNPTINSGTYEIVAECHEEHDIQFKCRELKWEFSPNQTSDIFAPIANKLVKGLFLFKEAAAGGTSVTTVTDVTLPDYNVATVPRVYFKNAYLAVWPTKDAQDPVFNDKLMPIVFPEREFKIPDMVYIPNQALIRLTSTFTTPDLIMNMLAPIDEEQMRRTLADWGLPQNTPLKVKSGKKTATDPNAWGRYRAFMPRKV